MKPPGRQCRVACWSRKGCKRGLFSQVCWSEQVSFRTRCLLMLDWVKRGVFGRDLSRF